MKEIKIAITDDEIGKCYAVMAELRPYLSSEKFLEQVRMQGKDFG